MECFKLEQPPPSLLIPSLAAGAEVSLRRRGTSSDPRLVLQGKKPGQNVQLDVPPAALGLIERLDGTRSVAEAYQKFLAEAAVPSPEIDLEMTLRLVKQLLRAGAMRLRAGAVKFGGGWEDVPWWQCRDP
jgi:hypothetical protein